jgi:hypothetical protein
MWHALGVFVTLVSLFLYASLWAPSLGRYFYWGRSDIRLGWVTRLGFTIIFGSFALMLTVGPPGEGYAKYYGAAFVLGFVLVLFGGYADWLRDRA